MKTFLKTTWTRFRRDEKGVTLVEYGIAVSLAIILGVGALSVLAGDVGDAMGTAGGQMCTDAATCGN
jgi:Flp pilus assembly pilin Flp